MHFGTHFPACHRIWTSGTSKRLTNPLSTEQNVIIIIKYVFLIAQEMTNVGEENNAKMECVFLLKDAFHHVEMEEYAGKEYVFLHALIIHNVDLDSDARIRYVFLILPTTNALKLHCKL